MPYRFNCLSCKEYVYTEQKLKKNTNYECTSCNTPNWLSGTYAKFEEIDDLTFENKEKYVSLDKVKKIDTSIKLDKTKTYPALIFLSKVANFLAWLMVGSSLIIGVVFIAAFNNPSFGEMVFPLLGIALITFISFVFWRAISEILILFVDIAKDVREIRLKK